ncbi:MAG: hypothetical protein ACFN27_03490, partial [Prevotella sp.]
MKMKKILPIAMFASVPLLGMGQNKSGLVMKNLDKTVSPAVDFYQSYRLTCRRRGYDNSCKRRHQGYG